MLLISLVSCMVPAVATADIKFSDNTFNLSDYAISKYQDGSAEVTISQTLEGGNPGAALQIVTKTPAEDTIHFATNYLRNLTFNYDTALWGPINFLNASADVYEGVSRGEDVPQSTSGTFVPTITQGGNIYSLIFPISVPMRHPDNGPYFAPLQARLEAADFGLVDRLDFGAVDPSRHPDFSSGVLGFGVQKSFVSNDVEQISDFRLDNLVFDITSAVPEPETYAMLLAGLGFLYVMLRHRNKLKAS